MFQAHDEGSLPFARSNSFNYLASPHLEFETPARCELCRLFDWQIGRLGAFQYLVDQDYGRPKHILIVGIVRHKPARLAHSGNPFDLLLQFRGRRI